MGRLLYAIATVSSVLGCCHAEPQQTVNVNNQPELVVEVQKPDNTPPIRKSRESRVYSKGSILTSRQTYTDPKWRAVVEKAQERYPNFGLVFADDFEETRTKLRQEKPEYIIFVRRQEEINSETLREFNSLQDYDGDRIPDCVAGIITGTPESAIEQIGTDSVIIEDAYILDSAASTDKIIRQVRNGVGYTERRIESKTAEQIPGNLSPEEQLENILEQMRNLTPQYRPVRIEKKDGQISEYPAEAERKEFTEDFDLVDIRVRREDQPKFPRGKVYFYGPVQLFPSDLIGGPTQLVADSFQYESDRTGPNNSEDLPPAFIEYLCSDQNPTVAEAIRMHRIEAAFTLQKLRPYLSGWQLADRMNQVNALQDSQERYTLFGSPLTQMDFDFEVDFPYTLSFTKAETADGRRVYKAELQMNVDGVIPASPIVLLPPGLEPENIRTVPEFRTLSGKGFVLMDISDTLVEKQVEDFDVMTGEMGHRTVKALEKIMHRQGDTWYIEIDE